METLRLVYHIFIVLAVAGLLGVHGQGQDLTLQPGTAGTAVVQATVARIQEAEIFPSDNRLLRRIAYVETRDGVDFLTYRDGYFGGIWQVDEDIFNKTQDVATYPELLETYQLVVNAFGVDWPTSTWADLRRPFFSALGARIYFTLISDPIPVAGDLQGQGEYWKSHYNRDEEDTVQDFVDAVNEFELEECPVRGIDLVFVLDSSGSVGADNFDLVKGFVGDLTNSFTIGADDTQVGVITFSGIARTIFELNTYQNRSVLLEAIGNIPFMDDRGPSTHTADALNLLRVNAFSVEAGARDENLGIPRVAIVVTDGQSNINSSFTIPNAEAAHEAGIQIFAVGVGDDVDMDELEGIASDQLFVSQLSEFTIIEFQGLQRILVYDACIAPAVIEVEAMIEGFLDEGEVSFFQYQLPTQGMTVHLDVQEGSVVLYAASTIQNPNEALYDYKLETDSSADVFLDPETLEGRPQIVPDKRRQVGGSFTNTTVYISIEGEEDMNSFVLETTFGDTSTDYGATIHNTGCLQISVALVLLLLATL